MLYKSFFFFKCISANIKNGEKNVMANGVASFNFWEQSKEASRQPIRVISLALNERGERNTNQSPGNLEGLFSSMLSNKYSRSVNVC